MVRSENFDRHQFIGNPIIHVERMVQWDVDELVVINISNEADSGFQHDRHDYKDNKITDLFSFVRRIAEECRIPLTFGGQIRTFDDVNFALLSGADKVCVNTLLFDNPDLVYECILAFGSQAIVASVDYRVLSGIPLVYRDFGQTNTKIELFDWLKRIEALNVGEIFLNCIDKDGAANGFDYEILDKASSIISIPLIGCGGAGHPKHFLNCFQKTSLNAIAAGNFFHFTENAYPRVKQYLKQNSINVR